MFVALVGHNSRVHDLAGGYLHKMHFLNFSKLFCIYLTSSCQPVKRVQESIDTEMFFICISLNKEEKVFFYLRKC